MRREQPRRAIPLNVHVRRDWLKAWFYNPMVSGPDILPAVYGMYKEERTEQVAISIGPVSLFVTAVAAPVLSDYARKSAESPPFFRHNSVPFFSFRSHIVPTGLLWRFYHGRPEDEGMMRPQQLSSRCLI